MNLMNNLQALTQTHFDSGSLGGLATVVHRLAEAGQHPLTILQTDQPVRSMALVVRDGSPLATKDLPTTAPLPSMPVTPAPAELHVNLKVPGGAIGPADLVVATSGYAVFNAPAASTGFAVLLHAPDAPDKPPVFDSRQLGNGDAFAVTLFRPGRYTLTNAGTNATGQIRVSYPVVGDTPYRPPDALHVQLDGSGFQPNDIQLMPAQGIVVHVNNVQARIAIDLAEPDDGPSTGGPTSGTPTGGTPPQGGPVTPVVGRPGYRWVKPQPPIKPSA